MSSPSVLVASTRMYNVAPGATAAWHRLLARVIRESGVPLEIVDHAHPAPLAALWERQDLGCAFMCGWPLAQERGHRPVIAAPIPLGSNAARYSAVFIVEASSAFRTVEETFGGTFAFNAKGSHSGWNMPQAWVSQLGGSYVAYIGPFGPHQRSVEAVAAGKATVAAIDSLVWALMCRHAPSLTGRLRVIGSTPHQPSPPLVGSAALDPGDAGRLRAALVALKDDPDGQALLADVCLAGFAPAELAEYDETLIVGQ